METMQNETTKNSTPVLSINQSQNLQFLFEVRLKKMDIDANFILEDLKLNLVEGKETFDLKPVEKEYPDGSALQVTVTNVNQGKGEYKDRYYINGPIEATVFFADNTSIRFRVPVDNQQAPKLDAIRQIADNGTVYMKITSNNGSYDQMYFLNGQRDEEGFRVVAKYGADIQALENSFNELKLPSSKKRETKLFESIKNGHSHLVELPENGVKVERTIYASRSNDMTIRDKNGQIISLEKSGLKAPTRGLEKVEEAQVVEMKNNAGEVLKKANQVDPPAPKHGKGKTR